MELVAGAAGRSRTLGGWPEVLLLEDDPVASATSGRLFDAIKGHELLQRVSVCIETHGPQHSFVAPAWLDCVATNQFAHLPGCRAAGRDAAHSCRNDLDARVPRRCVFIGLSRESF